jgi:hypothetical protein
MSADELLDYLRDTFTTALTRPELPKFVALLIGSIPARPKLAAIYRDEFVEPLWQSISTVSVADIVTTLSLLHGLQLGFIAMPSAISLCIRVWTRSLN